MQTFLPLTDFALSARVLDRQRLGKQRVEAKQIVEVLEAQARTPGRPVPWGNHPAARMWRGFVPVLISYGIAMCYEWRERGYADSLLPWFQARALAAWPHPVQVPQAPGWLGQEEFHAAHRAALLAKLPEHYGRFGWTEEPRIAYLWPVGPAQCKAKEIGL